MDSPQTPPEPANLRFLRILVTVLTAVMIGGLITIVALLVIRFSGDAPVVPDNVTLPEGVEAEAFTLGADWYAVVTKGGAEILVFDRASGALRKRVPIE